MTVFLKTNALAPHPASKAITTHPSVVRAVIRYFKQYNVKILVGDNPATKEMTTVYKVNGTLDVVNECKYDGAFTFIYSKRDGTPAALMEDIISLEEKNERLQTLNNLVNKYSLESNQKLMNTIQKVLLIGNSEKDDNKLYGYTETMKLVNVKCDKNLVGTIQEVKIIDAKSFSLEGIIE